MNQVLTDLHNKRYEWALQAKREYLDHFIRLDVKKVNEIIENEIQSSQKMYARRDLNPLTFQSLKRCIELVNFERKKEFEKNRNTLDRLEQFIIEKKAQYDKKLNFFHMKSHELSSKIKTYKEFSIYIEKVIQEMDNIDIETYVKNFLNYNLNDKKASILNRCGNQLQFEVEKRIENLHKEIKARAIHLNIRVDNTELPQLNPISKIQQKIDAFWLKSSYDKAFNRLFSHSFKWVKQMFTAYKEILIPILNKAIQQHDQLVSEAEAWKKKNEVKINNLYNEITNAEVNKSLLYAECKKIEEIWKQDCDHVNNLQGYFIKHWLRYKDDLQYLFLSGNSQERWVISHYLQLLLQDGEDIIESMKI